MTIKLFFKNFAFSLILFISTLLLSCEGTNVAKGSVVEDSTNEVLDSVLCKVIETGEVTYTDSQGEYYLNGPFGSCVRDCPDMTVEYSKEGFLTIEKVNPGKETIHLSN